MKLTQEQFNNLAIFIDAGARAILAKTPLNECANVTHTASSLLDLLSKEITSEDKAVESETLDIVEE